MRSYQGFQRLVVFVFVITMFAPVAEAQKSAKRQQWEYCAILAVDTPILNNPSKTDGKVTATTTICFFRGGGCIREQVRFEASETNLVKDLDVKDLTQVWVGDAARTRAAQAALAKAAAQLGNDGWEMVAPAPIMLGPTTLTRELSISSDGNSAGLR